MFAPHCANIYGQDMPHAMKDDLRRIANPKDSLYPTGDDIEAVAEKKLFLKLCRKYLPDLSINPGTGIADPGPSQVIAAGWQPAPGQRGIVDSVKNDDDDPDTLCDMPCELAQDLVSPMEHYGCLCSVQLNLMFSESYDLNNSGESYDL